MCSCSASAFSDGHLAVCEVGDLSGKFGVIPSAMATDRYLFSMVRDGDPMPPLPYDFVDAYDGVYDGSHGSGAAGSTWGSVVLNCPLVDTRHSELNDPPLLCARLVKVPPPSPSSSTPAKPAPSRDPSQDAAGEHRYSSSFKVPGTTGYFKVNIDPAGVGSYDWKFDLSGLKALDSASIAEIQEYGVKCESPVHEVDMCL